jgi:hypothetical protein
MTERGTDIIPTKNNKNNYMGMSKMRIDSLATGEKRTTRREALLTKVGNLGMMKSLRVNCLMSRRMRRTSERRDCASRLINCSIHFLMISIYCVSGKTMKRKEVQMTNLSLVYYGFTEAYLLRDLIVRDWLREPIEMALKKVFPYLPGHVCYEFMRTLIIQRLAWFVWLKS